MSLRETLGNRQWLKDNEKGLKSLFPDTWTLDANLCMVRVGFGLKLLGVDWRSDEELIKVLVFLEKTGLLLRQNGHQLRTNPSTV